MILDPEYQSYSHSNFQGEKRRTSEDRILTVLFSTHGTYSCNADLNCYYRRGIWDFPDYATFREKGAKLVCVNKLGVSSL